MGGGEIKRSRPGAHVLEDRVRWSAKGLANRMKSLPVAFG